MTSLFFKFLAAVIVSVLNKQNLVIEAICTADKRNPTGQHSIYSRGEVEGGTIYVLSETRLKIKSQSKRRR